MIRFLEGQLRFKDQDQLIISCAGVGYRCAVPTSLPPRLGEPGEAVEVWVHTQVRDDAIRLLGFGSRQDLEIFETLLTVNGLGPRIALNMLSAFSAAQITQALRREDIKYLSQASGVGKRLAQRMVMELGEKMPVIDGEPAGDGGTAGSGDAHPHRRDIESGLLNLGFKAREVVPVVADVVEADPDGAFKDLFTRALGQLRSGARR